MGFISGLFSAWKQGRQEHNEARDEIIDLMTLVHQNEHEMILDAKNVFDAMIALEQIHKNKNDFDGSKLFKTAREEFPSITILYILAEVSKRTGKPALDKNGLPMNNAKNLSRSEQKVTDHTNLQWRAIQTTAPSNQPSIKKTSKTGSNLIIALMVFIILLALAA